MQRDCWFSHTWLSVCTCVYVCSEATIFPFLLTAKVAHVLHLVWGRVRERGRKGRKLPGKVLRCFKNLSSHSAKLSRMNNRFGTWPACTGESVIAALWSGFPTFDGCAVSQNSWKRGAPAECMRWRGKKKPQTKSKKFLCEADTRIWALPAQDASPCGMACGTLLREEQTLVPHRPPSFPNEDQGEGASRAMQPQMHVQQELPSGGAQRWVHHLLQLPQAFFQWETTSLGPSRCGMPQQHQQPGRVGRRHC